MKQVFPLTLETDEQSLEEVDLGARQPLGSLSKIEGEVLFDWHINDVFTSKLQLTSCQVDSSVISLSAEQKVLPHPGRLR